MVRMFFDMFPVDADEFHVKVVRKDDCMWRNQATFRTMQEAREYVHDMRKDDYRLIGIQPQKSEMYPFQTHPLQHVYEG